MKYGHMKNIMLGQKTLNVTKSYSLMSRLNTSTNIIVQSNLNSDVYTTSELYQRWVKQCLSQELKKVRHMSHQAEKGETCLTKLRHVSRS